jgi:hypothetical protein
MGSNSASQRNGQKKDINREIRTSEIGAPGGHWDNKTGTLKMYI